MEITIDNYFVSSIASFKACKRPKRKPDYISYNKYGYISSMYWYGEDKNGQYVIRHSDHWSHVHTKDWHCLTECIRVARCYWVLYGKDVESCCGKCHLKNFKYNNKIK